MVTNVLYYILLHLKSCKEAKAKPEIAKVSGTKNSGSKKGFERGGTRAEAGAIAEAGVEQENA